MRSALSLRAKPTVAPTHARLGTSRRVRLAGRAAGAVGSPPGGAAAVARHSCSFVGCTFRFSLASSSLKGLPAQHHGLGAANHVGVVQKGRYHGAGVDLAHGLPGALPAAPGGHGVESGAKRASLVQAHELGDRGGVAVSDDHVFAAVVQPRAGHRSQKGGGGFALRDHRVAADGDEGVRDVRRQDHHSRAGVSDRLQAPVELPRTISLEAELVVATVVPEQGVQFFGCCAPHHAAGDAAAAQDADSLAGGLSDAHQAGA